MATDEMYDLAYRYRETKLWNRLWDTELFAVALPDGETGYCCVMGHGGIDVTLALYVGDEGFRSLSIMAAPLSEEEERRMTTMLLLEAAQNCLQCSFMDKDMLSDAEIEEVRAYAKRRGRTFHGANSFVEFVKYIPGRQPWHYEGELDNSRICEALSAAIELNERLQGKRKTELGIHDLSKKGMKDIPLLVREGDHWDMRHTPIPRVNLSIPETVFINEVLARRIRKKEKRGVWQCGTLWLPEFVESEVEGEAPFMSLALVYLNPEEEYVPFPLISNVDDSEELMNDFAEKLAKAEPMPGRLLCGDDLAYALLHDLCNKAGLEIERSDDLQELREFSEELAEHMAGEEDDEDEEDVVEGNVVDVLRRLSDVDLIYMPPELRDQFAELARRGAFPDDLNRRILRLFS